MTTSLAQLEERFRRARGKYTVDRQPNHINVEDLVDELRNVAVDAVYTENSEGGKARDVVANVARTLDVDLDYGTGNRWDAVHMWRVVGAVKALRDDRNHWESEAANWHRQAVAGERDAVISSLRSRRDEWRRKAEAAETAAATERARAYEFAEKLEALGTTGVDALKATIVRQANEITELKGESE